MTGKHSLTAVALATLLTGPTQAAPEQGSLRECQRIKGQIDYYSKLRRTGGNSASMEYWQRKRSEYQDAFSAQDCQRWHKMLD